MCSIAKTPTDAAGRFCDSPTSPPQMQPSNSRMRDMRNELLPMKKRKLRYNIEPDGPTPPPPPPQHLPTPPPPVFLPPPAPASPRPPPRRPPPHRAPSPPVIINQEAERPPEASSPEHPEHQENGEIVIEISKEDQIRAQDLWVEIVLNEMYPEGHPFQILDRVILEPIELPEHFLLSSENEGGETPRRPL